jgi:alpha-mannosidase
MDQYPDYVYFQSQPQLYEWVKENQPQMWERIKRQVKAGKWELNGAAWVEQDTNVPSGESHVRQFLYGNRFFRKEFGVHTRVFWLPDCFGFSFSLPQIIKKAQIDAFATTKLSSNEYNEFPYDLFRWRGLDGTELLTYQLPWEWRVEPAALLAHWNRFKQKTATDEIPLTFGLGDGGGGPTTEMIENGRRLANLKGFPKAQFGSFQGHFDHLNKTLNWDDLPVFNDELYYEKHRGCQTAQARTKRNNRKSEVSLHDAEFLASCATRMGATYPQDELYSAWKLVMLNQFHDILPGSSIAQVYEDADRDYATARNTVRAVTDAAVQTLAEKIDTAGEGDAVIVWNTLGWRRTDVATVRVPSGDGAEWCVFDHKGKPVASQPVTVGDGAAALVFEAKNLPSLGYSVYRLKRSPSIAAGKLKATSESLENAYFSIRFAKDGSISRIFDKKMRREVLANHARGNDLIVFEDYPAGADAWDIDFNFDEKSAAIREAVSIEVTETGPVRATVRIVKKTAKSTITQDVSIWSILPRIDFQTSVEWNEKHKLLKAAFPVDVLSRKATYEIQFGAIERPTHRSSPVDRARFEVTGHKWIDLSEGDYGVSLLNDSKYGFDVKENTMRISLLRSSVSPDPHADEGHHDFAYSLYPHAGGWQDAGTVQRGHEFNAPLVCWLEKAHGGALPPMWSLVETDAPGLVIDTVKKAEDSDAIVVRTYESHGGRTEARLKFYAPPSSVTECDLMEENDVPVDLNGNTVTFEAKPWEIRSFKVSW